MFSLNLIVMGEVKDVIIELFTGVVFETLGVLCQLYKSVCKLVIYSQLDPLLNISMSLKNLLLLALYILYLL
jgi:hypothetical protein